MATSLGAGTVAQCGKVVPTVANRKPFGQRMNFRSKCAEWERKTVTNGIKTRQMLVWNPFDNKKCETFSYLPPLNDDEISRQVDYITANGWVACIEFADQDQAYIADESNERFGAVSAGYYDNRYWTMWKLPMFGCADPRQVIQEISACKKAFPNAYSRLVAFDPLRQVQISSFVVNHPTVQPKIKIGSEEVSTKPVRSAGYSSYSNTSSSSYSYDWNSSTTETKKDDWSYDWNKTETTTDSWSDWNKTADTKDSWSYDWNTTKDTTDSWKTEEKKDWTYDWNSSADTSKSTDYTYDWSKREDSTFAADSTNSWSSDWNKQDSYSSSSSWDRGSDISGELREVQQKLDRIKDTVDGAYDKVSDKPSYSSNSNDYSSSVASLERSWNYDRESTKDEKSAWYSW